MLLLWNANKLSVTTDDKLTTEKVKIQFGDGVNTISKKNEIEQFGNNIKYKIVFDGGVKDRIVNEYGENDFLINYDDNYYYSFRHFKLNRRHQHDYNFHFYQIKNKIYVQVNIIGRDAMAFASPMIKIEQASEY